MAILTSSIIILPSFLYACLKISVNLIDRLYTQAHQLYTEIQQKHAEFIHNTVLKLDNF